MVGADGPGGPARLKGKVALVTGASRGLGKAIALAIAREGADVAVVARTEEPWDERLPGTVHETVAEIEALGGRALAVPADLTDQDQLEQVAASTEKELGAIDILVNNAALTVGGRPPAPGTKPIRKAANVQYGQAPSILDVPLKAYRLHLAVNVLAPYRLMQLVLPGMLARRTGAIVNVSSNAAFAPGEGPYAQPGTPALFAYGSTKAALHNLTQGVAVEVADRGVAVNVLLPSLPIRTPGATSLLDGSAITQWAEIGDFAEAAVRLALASPASTTGQLLFHDDVLHPQRARLGWQSTECT